LGTVYLKQTGHEEDALVVREARLSMLRRIGAPEESVLVAQTNLAITYGALGQIDRALQLERGVYHGSLRLLGEEDTDTLIAANNYADSLIKLERFEEAKSLLRKTFPVTRRVFEEGNDTTLRLRWNYAKSLYKADGATLGDLREAVATLEDAGRTARRVLGAAHPLTVDIEEDLEGSRAALRAREGDVESLREAVGAMTPGDA